MTSILRKLAVAAISTAVTVSLPLFTDSGKAATFTEIGDAGETTQEAQYLDLPIAKPGQTKISTVQGSLSNINYNPGFMPSHPDRDEADVYKFTLPWSSLFQSNITFSLPEELFDIESGEVGLNVSLISLAGEGNLIFSETEYFDVPLPPKQVLPLPPVSQDLTVSLQLQETQLGAGEYLLYFGGAYPELGSSSNDFTPIKVDYNATLEIEGVPEPLTILGSATALGFGALFKRQQSRKQKKS
ncbi:MAG: PEP-CTERM sorting domain-containing protein [Coleofasciculus sp. C1-SOL-03]|uniref:PEP-CTERM sorting domain-containing protein n=1 Tax=Coleofasciculus sp. C1-SOL-03 TaxID=3069522 RepID=UPI0032FBC5E7